jgi:hypothetical protein
VVFILIDSFSRVSGSDEDGKKLLARITELGDVVENLVFKVLVTDLLPRSVIDKVEHITLQLPDNVDGGKRGLDVELFQRENALAFQRIYERQQDLEDRLFDDESSDGDW